MGNYEHYIHMIQHVSFNKCFENSEATAAVNEATNQRRVFVLRSNQRRVFVLRTNQRRVFVFKRPIILQDAEFGNKGIGNLQELMDVLPNIDVSDVMDIPKVFRCDEQTLPCDHTTKYRTLTGWCNNLVFPEYGKSIRAFTRLLAPAIRS